jgi:hypothetical protein
MRIFFLPCAGRHHDELHARRVDEKIIAREKTKALLRPQIAASDEACEPAVSRAIARKRKNVGRAIAKDETGADRKLETVGRRLVVSCIDMGADDAGKRIAVGNPNSGKAEVERMRNQLFRMRSAAQEGKIRGDGKFREGNAGPRGFHAKSPCMNQRSAMISVS